MAGKTLICCLTFLIVSVFGLNAQILQPASWQVQLAEEAPAAGTEVDIVFTVEIDEDWYLYSTDFDPDLGPQVTEINFEPHSSYELVGGLQPINSKKKYDDIWEGEYTYFEGTAEIRQTILVLEEELQIAGKYAYQVCTDIDGRCIPFRDEFVIGESAESSAETGEKDDQGVMDTSASEEPTMPITQEIEEEKPASLWAFAIIAFMGGLAALLTPCVFPMIPMTVTFFSSTSQGRSAAITKAVLYGVSIILIYTLAGTLVAWINGPGFANWLSTHWLPNMLFFAIFIVFGLSFLGLFEITLPSSWVNNIDRQADRGKYLGVFFMAFTLVLVSFSCTGPIVGSILVESAGGEVIKPIIGMMSFSAAFAIPFTMFAIFPEWLNNLPKSGGWLNSVKVILGFLELALALKFLSMADQIYHWGLLDRDVFLVLWIVIFAFIGFYLLGKIRLKHDAEVKQLNITRLLLSIATFSFVVYMIPGLWGAPLKFMAGFLPPMSGHDFDMNAMLRAQQQSDGEDALCETPLYTDFLHFPHGIKGYFDYDQALECAKEQNKPVFIDFTGHGCVNCREMEANIWSHPEVLNKFSNDFVMLALYVDERNELPEAAWYKSEYDGKLKKTIGEQNTDRQISQYNNNAQPYYLILSPDGELLTKPFSYTRDPAKFLQFLDAGLNNYHQ